MVPANVCSMERARRHTWRVRCDIRRLLRGGRRSDVEECAGSREVLGAVGIGKKLVVADAVEAPGQHVHQETPDEFVGVNAPLVPVAVRV